MPTSNIYADPSNYELSVESGDMLGQVEKYSEIINNGRNIYFQPPKISFSVPKIINCPNIFSPLPRSTFGSPFILKSAPKTFC